MSRECIVVCNFVASQKFQTEEENIYSSTEEIHGSENITTKEVKKNEERRKKHNARDRKS